MYLAKTFVAHSPQTEVLGQSLMSYIENTEADQLLPLLQKHELDHIDRDKWYSYQDWLTVLQELDAELGSAASYTFVAIGRKAVETAALPPELSSIPQFLNMLNTIYHVNVRNSHPDEGYQLQQVGEQDYLIYHNGPTPNDLIYGFLWGIAARFKGPDEVFTLSEIENDRPTSATVAYQLSWGVD